MSMTDELTNIPQTDDDFTLAEPAQYPEGGIELLPAGTYDFQMTDYTLVCNDPLQPNKVTAVDVELTVIGARDEKYLKRRTGRVRVFTKRFERKPGLYASGFGDFVRGISEERWAGQDAGIAILAQAKDRAVPIQIRVDWEAFDKKGYQSEGGDTLQRGSVEQKDLRNRATVKGMSNFPAYADDTHRDSIEGPISHEDIQARLVIRGVTAQSKRKTMPARL